MAEIDDLARQIRGEILGREPPGFGAHLSVNVQGHAVETLAAALKDRPAELVSPAIAQLVENENDPWIYLKLVELCKELKPQGASSALLHRIENPPPETSERRLFMQGCSCEVLLELELDGATRKRAEQLCGPPLFHLARVRAAVGERVKAHRPRLAEWVLLLAAMIAAAGAVAYVVLFR